MAQIHQPEPVKLIAALLAGRAEWLDAAEERLRQLFGATDTASDDMPFTFTDYYRQQMGSALLRRLLSFARLIDPGELAAIKRQTNAVEAELTEQFDGVPRPVNIDPGYIEPSKLVLASTKNFAHRLYLGAGIYAEVTLQYRHGTWEAGQWTFPDYRSRTYDAFLTEVRDRLMKQH
ncbi:MAG: DUF4416 family protein [Planctomycetes bacterium]|nr:DUF4416 family protein [Planctomycetota bacterium]